MGYPLSTSPLRSPHLVVKLSSTMAKTLLFTAPFILQALPSVNAWGTLGHDTVAYIAQNFVTSATKTFCQNILGDTSTSYLANVATWADTYRYTAEGSFSAPYHFIDAEDNPPTSCNVDYNRDCGADGCVVSAIQNYVCRPFILPCLAVPSVIA